MFVIGSFQMKFSVDIYSRIAHIDHRGEIMHQWYTWEILLEMLHLKRFFFRHLSLSMLHIAHVMDR